MNTYPSRWSVSGCRQANKFPVANQTSPFGLSEQKMNFDRSDISTVLPEMARSLHDEIRAATGASPELIVTILLSTTAVATQCKYDVEYLDIIRCPTSLAGICVAGSTYGKTTVINQLTQAHRDFQASEEEKKTKEHEYQAALKVWKAKEKSLAKKIERSLDDNEALLELQAAYASHLKNSPVHEKTAGNIVLRDTTFPALAKSIETQSACTSWISDEAGSILPYLNRLMPHLNAVWDGTEIKRDRISSASAFQKDPRLTIVWGVQPKRFAKYIEENGADFVDIGMGSRTLIAVCRPPTATVASRNAKVGREARERHNDTLAGIFGEYSLKMNGGQVGRIAFTLNKDAKEQFRQTIDWMATARSTHARLSKVPAFAGRIAENILRVAANLHVIEGRPGAEIELDVIQSAIQLMIFYAEQHEAIFGDVIMPAEERHALRVLEFLEKKFCAWEFTRTPWSDRRISARTIQQHVGAKDVRNSRKNVDAALIVLERDQIVNVARDYRGIILGVELVDHYFRERQKEKAILHY